MTDASELLSQGIAALKSGQKAKARNLLEQVVQQDEQNESAWLWLSGAVSTDEERRTCLENVLAINPNNGVARRGLEAMATPILSPDRIESSVGPPTRPPKLASFSGAKKQEQNVSPPTDTPSKKLLRPQPQASPAKQTRACPFCAEEIQEAAIVCKHCGRELVSQAAPQIEIPAPISRPVNQKMVYGDGDKNSHIYILHALVDIDRIR